MSDPRAHPLAADRAERRAEPGYEFLGGLTETERAFRDELVGWLQLQLDGEHADLRGALAPVSEEEWRRGAAWERVMHAAGWRGIAWPPEYGGRGATFVEELVFEIEYARLQAPYRPSIQGERLLGPVMLAIGSPEVKRRFLPEIIAAREYWCQGFSEPDAGSDLASVRTVAVQRDGLWHVSGQKIWTTSAHHADWIYVLCRTEPGPQRHRGLSVLLVPMRQPGVNVRPITTMAGDAEFCEVFLDDAVTDASMVLGDPGEGWAVARRLLQVERGVTMLGHQLQYQRDLHATFDRARKRGSAGDAQMRQRLARQWETLAILRWSTSSMLARIAEGAEVGVRASLVKLMSSAWQRSASNLAVDVDEMAALVADVDGDRYTQRFFLESRGASIYGGSDEIQRNLVAEHGLGLPRS